MPITTYIIAAMVVGMSNADEYHEPTALEQEVIGRYVQAARQLDQKYAHITGTAILIGSEGATPENRKGKPWELGRRITFSRDGSDAVVITEMFDTATGASTPRGGVLGKNSKYDFHLGRNTSGSGDGYHIFWLGKDPVGKVDLGMRRFCFDHLNAARGTFVGISSFVFSRPGLKVNSIETIEYDKKKAYKIEYRHAPSSENTAYTTGWIIVSPDEGWVTREYLCRGDDGGASIHGTVHYRRADPSGDLIPWEVLVTSGEMPERCEFTSLDFKSLDKAKFQISAFGFPEDLAFRQNKAPHSGLVWFLLALCALASSIVLWRVGRVQPTPQIGVATGNA